MFHEATNLAKHSDQGPPMIASAAAFPGRPWPHPDDAYAARRSGARGSGAIHQLGNGCRHACGSALDRTILILRAESEDLRGAWRNSILMGSFSIGPNRPIGLNISPFRRSRLDRSNSSTLIPGISSSNPLGSYHTSMRAGASAARRSGHRHPAPWSVVRGPSMPSDSRPARPSWVSEHAPCGSRGGSRGGGRQVVGGVIVLPDSTYRQTLRISLKSGDDCADCVDSAARREPIAETTFKGVKPWVRATTRRRATRRP